MVLVIALLLNMRGRWCLTPLVTVVMMLLKLKVFCLVVTRVRNMIRSSRLLSLLCSVVTLLWLTVLVILQVLLTAQGMTSWKLRLWLYG